MKLNNKLLNIHPETFLTDYLEYCGIDNPAEFLEPTEFDIETPEHYDNMQEAYETLMKVIGK